LLFINCNKQLDVTLGEKIRYLRLLEGTLRGLGREMTQLEVARATKRELNTTISQSYLSQIENGVRPHLSNTTRTLLARFFRVHPGYLVDDPEGFHHELTSTVTAREQPLDLWLADGAERFRRDPEVSQVLLRLAKNNDTRKCLMLLGAILETPDLIDRLLQVLKPEKAEPKPDRKSAMGVNTTT
jgi:transcriptional regulator with XRE-family HTH domain